MNNTPGEWYAKDGQIYSLENGKTIAHIYPSDSQDDDARLMSASKEMLEALEVVDDFLMSIRRDHGIDATYVVERVVRQTISKAKYK